jgi:hypothetical protein
MAFMGKMKFLNRFCLFSGLSRMKCDNIPKNEKYEEAIVNHFNCDPKWPVCLYDFTYKNLCENYFVYRTREMPPIFEDYFGNPEVDGSRKPEIEHQPEYENLVIER